MHNEMVFYFSSVKKLKIASLDMSLEQPPRETPQLKCWGVEHQEFYSEQYSW